MDFLVKIFKALANQHRIELLHLLQEGEQEIAGLSNRLGLPYKTVARNLKILERTNLVLSRRFQGTVYYSLRDEEHLDYNKILFNVIEKRFNRDSK